MRRYKRSHLTLAQETDRRLHELMPRLMEQLAGIVEKEDATWRKHNPRKRTCYLCKKRALWPKLLTVRGSIRWAHRKCLRRKFGPETRGGFTAYSIG